MEHGKFRGAASDPLAHPTNFEVRTVPSATLTPETCFVMRACAERAELVVQLQNF